MRLLIICLVFIVVSCSSDKTETIFVSGKLAGCTGVAPQKCLQIKFNQDDDWMYFYNSIDGFTHKEGTDFTLKVKREEIENPPADAASFKYILIEIVEEHPTPIDLEDGSWLVSGIVSFNQPFKREPVLTFSPKQNQVSGSTGCNRLFGKLFKEKNKLKFENIATTRMACDDDGLEQAFLKTLETVAAYQIQDGVLMLLDNQNNTVIKARHIERKE
jgi:heat shock protein HslJ